MAGTEVEVVIAQLLGAPEDVAVAAVETISEHGLLEHGVLLLAVLGSARWGADAVEALRRFADGQEPPSGWSDYEGRTAIEEAQEEAEAALLRLDAMDLPVALSDQVRAVLAGHVRGAHG